MDFQAAKVIVFQDKLSMYRENIFIDLNKNKRITYIKSMKNSNDLFNHFCKTCDDENIAQNSDLILAAFSGGADSVTLLDLLYRLNDERGGFQLAACHYNHQLRDEADDEQRQVEEFCQTRNIKLIIGNGNVAAEADRRVSVSKAASSGQLHFQRITILPAREKKILFLILLNA